MDTILALSAPFLRMTACSLPIGQIPFGKQRNKPSDLVGLFTLDMNFGENYFLIERAFDDLWFQREIKPGRSPSVKCNSR